MKLELLLSTMNLKDETENNKLIQKMNVNINTLTINQITNKNIKETNNLTSKNKLISVRDKGLSKSRNMAINNSEADICIIADDDVIYKDNFQNIIKKELINHVIYNTFEDARISIFNFIEKWYNRERIHGSINNMTPIEFEQNELYTF